MLLQNPYLQRTNRTIHIADTGAASLENRIDVRMKEMLRSDEKYAANVKKTGQFESSIELKDLKYFSKP